MPSIRDNLDTSKRFPRIVSSNRSSRHFRITIESGDDSEDDLGLEEEVNENDVHITSAPRGGRGEHGDGAGARDHQSRRQIKCIIAAGEEDSLLFALHPSLSHP